MRNVEYGAGAALALGLVALRLTRDGRAQYPFWQRDLALDAEARSALRLDSASARSAVATISDVTLWTSMLYPLVVDPALVSWNRAEPELGRELAASTSLALLSAAVFQEVMKHFTGRARPYLSGCADDDRDGDLDCESADAHRSFVSGHATMAFAGASVGCVHHARLPLYDDPLADASACAGALVVAAATAIARVLADKHHLSDVLAGAAAGALIGTALPFALRLQ
jgi:membrane-associated phospholipid phosphatase